MKTFLEKYLAPKPGDIVDTAGAVVGQHEGIHNYTIGQRKGLGIAAPNPLYVVSLDVGRNQVVVGERDSVTASECTITRVNWVSIAAAEGPIKAEVQIRYRSQAVGATIVPVGRLPNLAIAVASDNAAGGTDRVKVIFDQPQFGVTPGQAAVWYESSGRVLGGRYH